MAAPRGVGDGMAAPLGVGDGMAAPPGLGAVTCASAWAKQISTQRVDVDAKNKCLRKGDKEWMFLLMFLVIVTMA